MNQVQIIQLGGQRIGAPLTHRPLGLNLRQSTQQRRAEASRGIVWSYNLCHKLEITWQHSLLLVNTAECPGLPVTLHYHLDTSPLALEYWTIAANDPSCSSSYSALKLSSSNSASHFKLFRQGTSIQWTLQLLVPCMSIHMQPAWERQQKKRHILHRDSLWFHKNMYQ